MGVNSLPETVTRQRRGCDLNPGPSAPESSMLTTPLPSHPIYLKGTAVKFVFKNSKQQTAATLKLKQFQYLIVQNGSFRHSGRRPSVQFLFVRSN